MIDSLGPALKGTKLVLKCQAMPTRAVGRTVLQWRSFIKASPAAVSC